MPDELSKNQQRLIKNLLQSKKARTKNRCFVVEGMKNVEELLNSDYMARFVVVTEEFFASNSKFIKQLYEKIPKNRIYQLNSDEFNKLTDTITPQGILAVAEFHKTDVKNVIHGNFLAIALDRVKDPGNVGTIIRIADAAAADVVIAGKGCADIYNPKVVRAAMGSLFHVPVVESEDLTKTLEDLKLSGVAIVTTHLAAKRFYFDVNYKKALVIVMGSEDEGVSDDIAQISDETVKIPMPGKAESLNVAVSCGIIVFEAVKQRIKL